VSPTSFPGLRLRPLDYLGIAISEKVSNCSIDTKDFEKFLTVQKNLSDATVKNHLRALNTFLKYKKPVEDFLTYIKETKSSETYKNYLSMFKLLYRDYLKQPEVIQDFKFPHQQYKPKILPNKNQLRIFYNALPDKYKVIFLALASSGLRISELLDAKIDKENRMFMPKSHNGSTKKAWISFYNKETEELLKKHQGNPFETSRNTVAHTFKDVADKTGINISAHTLRSVFAHEMGKAGVQDRYIDAFCGRTPQSVLARHYSNFSPEVLKEIYDEADLKILL
jgi:site-specific recombinase XerD